MEYAKLTKEEEIKFEEIMADYIKKNDIDTSYTIEKFSAHIFECNKRKMFVYLKIGRVYIAFPEAIFEYHKNVIKSEIVLGNMSPERGLGYDLIVGYDKDNEDEKTFMIEIDSIIEMIKLGSDKYAMDSDKAEESIENYKKMKIRFLKEALKREETND